MTDSLVPSVCALFHHRNHRLVLVSPFFTALKSRSNVIYLWSVIVDNVVSSLEVT